MTQHFSRRGPGEKVHVVAEIGEEDDDKNLQHHHQQEQVGRLVDEVGVVLLAGVHNGQLQVGHQIGDDGGQCHGVDNGLALLGAHGVAAVHLHQGDAQHHEGHHGDAGGTGEVKQPGIIDAEDPEKDPEQAQKQHQALR